MNILIVGSGAREHCLAWSVLRSQEAAKVYLAPGNGGTKDLDARAENISIAATDTESLLKFAIEKHIDLTIVGPEQPLELGIVNLFRAAGKKITGPTKEAARLETSKAFAKAFMYRHQIPTAAFETFTSHVAAKNYVSQHTYPQVIKASGLAAGKGVIVAMNEREAFAALEEMFEQKVFGSAAQEVVIEAFMQGEEASLFVFTDGVNYKLLPAAQDHKRIGVGDTGKNTGGMGAYSPAPVVTAEVLRQAQEKIIEPTLRGMRAEGNPFTGFLYVGVMIENETPRVVEFNVRLGDPETEAVLPLLESKLLEVLVACESGALAGFDVVVKPLAASTVVMASGGYPDLYQTGKVITGQCHYQDGEDVMIFHAGTKSEHGKLRTAGGRVLAVTSLAATLAESLEKTYDAVSQIHFEGAYYRSDIGHRASVKRFEK
ncbi:MAG: phosphoribosylamine--glycine ligase [Rhizobacter sp.]|nr:phosphoribosylamine--glycine ligase [Chlorobiales bacterium]